MANPAIHQSSTTPGAQAATPANAVDGPQAAPLTQAVRKIASPLTRSKLPSECMAPMELASLLKAIDGMSKKDQVEFAKDLLGGMPDNNGQLKAGEHPGLAAMLHRLKNSDKSDSQDVKEFSQAVGALQKFVQKKGKVKLPAQAQLELAKKQAFQAAEILGTEHMQFVAWLLVQDLGQSNLNGKLNLPEGLPPHTPTESAAKAINYVHDKIADIKQERDQIGAMLASLRTPGNQAPPQQVEELKSKLQSLDAELAGKYDNLFFAEIEAAYKVFCPEDYHAFDPTAQHIPTGLEWALAVFDQVKALIHLEHTLTQQDSKSILLNAEPIGEFINELLQIKQSPQKGN